MIAVRLTGGLGNQLFQYATGRALASRNGTQLILDSSWIDGDGGATGGSNRRYQLDRFELDAPLLPISEVAQLPHRRRTARRVQNVLARRRPVLRELAEPDFGRWCSEVLSAPDNTYLRGYWQTGAYFDDAESLLRSELAVKEARNLSNVSLGQMIRNSPLPTVSAHVRRGDYVTDPGANRRLGTLNRNYYRRAVERIQQEVGGTHVFIFSDDPDWCHACLGDIGYQTTIADTNDADAAADDLRLMSFCDHHLLANSTLGWWGAWLNTKPNKIVVAPRPWFIDPRWPDDLRTPADWIRLDRADAARVQPGRHRLRVR